jgi:hypothetical protein
MCDVRCAMCDVRCAMCDVRCAMCDVRCAYLEFIQDTYYDATSLSEQRERETSGSIEKIYR